METQQLPHRSVAVIAYFLLSLLLVAVTCRRANSAEVYPNVFDIVTLALKPTCVNRQMVASVNALLMPRPRTVHVIAARGCDVFETFSNNVMCYLDDKLVPSLNAKSVSEWFATRVKDRNDLDADRIERRSTWFFQQFMKLAAAAHIPGLSEYFLIFDSK
ncbi:hypothetical protein Vafri_5913 [Volvox africanus]|nr:hypothetical protein Vafri_5913 [Volvox africanus]